jgi:hypothetical protein
MSTRSQGQNFTAQGLGDRVHLVSVAYQISRIENCQTTLHLALNHWRDYKLDSFKEILALFPPGHVALKFHQHEFINNRSWSEYMHSKSSDSRLIGYKDHPGWLEPSFDIDVSLYLKDRFLIYPNCTHELALPKEFIVCQWDSTGIDRRLGPQQILEIEQCYSLLGLEKIVVGGESQNSNLRDCLACAGKAIAGAAFFVGVDSGFMHIACQVLPSRQIHLYTSPDRFWSHHLFRAIESGVQINFFGKKINSFMMHFIRLRYDSPRIIRIVHKLMSLKVSGK